MSRTESLGKMGGSFEAVPCRAVFFFSFAHGQARGKCAQRRRERKGGGGYPGTCLVYYGCCCCSRFHAATTRVLEESSSFPSSLLLVAAFSRRELIEAKLFVVCFVVCTD
jgi:hypothetical protein